MTDAMLSPAFHQVDLDAHDTGVTVKAPGPRTTTHRAGRSSGATYTNEGRADCAVHQDLHLATVVVVAGGIFGWRLFSGNCRTSGRRSQSFRYLVLPRQSIIRCKLQKNACVDVEGLVHAPKLQKTDARRRLKSAFVGYRPLLR